MTIHKSQGKTFDKVVVDIGRGDLRPRPGLRRPAAAARRSRAWSCGRPSGAATS
ncbi:MAG: hypothetical protein MZV64_29025 [Ignavibacteriales bacterium]|nr:hypothetical protein [Ignavibacteriales bacterium]